MCGKSNRNGKQKITSLVLAGFLALTAILSVPGRLWAIQDEPTTKEGRALSFFNGGLDPLADEQNGSLYSCSSFESNVAAAAALTFACTLFGIPPHLCGAAGIVEYEFNSGTAANLKEALKARFKNGLETLGAHPEESNSIVSALSGEFEGVLHDPQYKCLNIGSAMDDLNSLAGSVLLAFMLAPSDPSPTLVANITRVNSDSNLGEDDFRSIPSQAIYEGKEPAKTEERKCRFCGYLKSNSDQEPVN